jgi:hypothetical protein
VTSKVHPTVPLNEADYHYQLEEAELAYRVSEDKENCNTKEEEIVMLFLRRGSGN